MWLNTMELITKPTPGQWFWKEDSKTLEFSGTCSTSMSSGSKSQERNFTDQVTKSPRQINKRHDGYVTLQDVKRVALILLQEDERLCMVSFLETVSTQHIDAFLMALLYYLSCFLENAQYEKKPKSVIPNVIVLKHKEGAEHKRRTEFALKHFGYMYCNLILGEGTGNQHHMACGKSRASATQRDRRFYEGLYSFCIHVGWVVFRRKELAVIQAEIGRLMRSNTFNPALKMNDVQSEPDKMTKKTTTYAENWMVKAKQPAIKSLFTQRSPLLMSVIPRPKERSQYLFQKHVLHPEDCSEPKGPASWMEMFPAEIPTRIGILGEPQSQYHYNLIPVGAEDDEEPELQENKHTEPSYSRGLSSQYSHFRPGTGRQSMVMSRATTEAAYSDDN